MMKILKILIYVGFVDNVYVHGDVKVRDHCHITENYRCCAHGHCNISVVFNNQKNYDSHLITLKRNVTSNGLENLMSFNINNKLVFIDSPQLLNSSLDSLVKNLDEDDFNYLSQEFGCTKMGFTKM